MPLSALCRPLGWSSVANTQFPDQTEDVQPRWLTRYAALHGISRLPLSHYLLGSLYLVVHLVPTGDVDLVRLVIHVLAGPTNFATTLDFSFPANLGRQAVLRGHGGATRRPELAMPMTTTTTLRSPRSASLSKTYNGFSYGLKCQHLLWNIWMVCRKFWLIIFSFLLQRKWSKADVYTVIVTSLL